MNTRFALSYIIWNLVILFVVCCFIFSSVGGIQLIINKPVSEVLEPPTVTLNIDPYTVVYEGDIIDCEITGNPTTKYWQINGQSAHSTFQGDNPVIFDPEPTPLTDSYVDLSVYAENEFGNDSETVKVQVKRIFFGDIHWHTPFSDGNFDIDTMYKNAVLDNYLDFSACSDHGELLDGFNTLFQAYPRFGGVPWWDFLKTIFDKIRGYSEWQTVKEKAIEYYTPGAFTTLLGFEWTAAQWSPGGNKWSPNGWDDVGHIHFYYRDIYPDALEYSDLQKLNYDMIFQVMADEWDKGHLNIGFPHHPQGKASWVSFTTNWSYLAKGMKKTEERNKILRGVEVYSRWGTSIGQYFTPGLPCLWSYKEEQFYNQTDAWIENALWEWSDSSLKNQRFGMIASSDTHDYNRPASAQFNISHLAGPSGIVGIYVVHNTREEIWDAMNNCSMYGSQLLKIRGNARFDNQIAHGKWINCSSPLNITITAYSTFPGIDSSGKNMCPHGYTPVELAYPISDIWLIKKDTLKGRPWCTIIGHAVVNESCTVVTFTDPKVQPNDFYYIAIRQNGDMLSPHDNQYMAFLGPVFIDQVH